MKIVWSYSGQKTFQQCPRQYHEVKVLKTTKTKDSEATLYGKAVHEALEAFLKEGTPIPEKFAQFEPYARRVQALQGTHYVEYPMGLKEDGTYCDFDDADVWWHGIPDVLVVNSNTGVARVVDWKTSKSARYADVEQLELLALATFARNPEIHTVRGALIFIVCGDVVTKDFHRKDFALILSKWIGNIDRIKKAHDAGVWNPKKSPLCKWCPVSNSRCEYAS